MVSIAIVGETNIGKTYNSVLFAHKQFNGDILVLRHLEDLREFNPKTHKCLIFEIKGSIILFQEKMYLRSMLL